MTSILDGIPANRQQSVPNAMTHSKDNTPDCFGELEIVFPLGDDGLRHTPAPCFECPLKTECLRTGLEGRAGLNVHEEQVDRSYHAGAIGFVERWSRKKAIDRRKKNRKTSGFKWRWIGGKTKQSE
jgi:hypothetical protein